MAFKRREDMTDEELAAARDRMAAARAAKQSTRNQQNTDNPGERPSVEGEQVAPAAPEAEGHASSHDPIPLQLTDEALGALAKQLTGNRAVEEAFQRAVQACVDIWERTEPNQTVEREACYHDIRALRALRYQLGRISVAGDQARRARERLIA